MADNDNLKPPASEVSSLEGGKETLRTIIMALVIALVIRTFAYEPFNIPSSSMVPTLLVGDFLFVSKFSYGYGSEGTFLGFIPFTGRIFGHAPQRGDVVVFKLPRDPSVDYIKRLIGLPGDQCRCAKAFCTSTACRSNVTARKTDQRRRHRVRPKMPPIISSICRKGRRTSSANSATIEPLDNTDVFIVPQHHYFFMGDNRDNSQDSRAPHGGVGFVPEENLVGKAEFLFFSIDAHTHFWEVWTWPWTVRWSRLFGRIA